MTIDIVKTKTYIPDFNGNKELTEPDQVVVTYRAATIEIKERLKGTVKNVGRYDEAGNYKGMETTLVNTTDEQLMSELLVGIKGAAYKDGDKVIEVKDVKSLLSAPIEFDALKTEIVSVFRKEVYREKVNEKN